MVVVDTSIRPPEGRVHLMRLKDGEIAAIRDAVGRLDSTATVWLFGSRADDSKKGADIDLLIMSSALTRADIRSIKARLYDAIGEQKIDIVLAADDSDPFVKIALQTGVRL